LVEQALAELYYDFANRHSSTPVASYVGRRVRRVQNVNVERLQQLVGDFDQTWAADLNAFLTEQLRNALNSVVANRNRIAHGDSVSVGLAQMKAWLSDVVTILEFLEQQCR